MGNYFKPTSSYGYGPKGLVSPAIELVPESNFIKPYPGQVYLFYYNEDPNMPDFPSDKLTLIPDEEIYKNRKMKKVHFVNEDQLEAVILGMDKSFDNRYYNKYVREEIFTNMDENGDMEFLDDPILLKKIKEEKEEYLENLKEEEQEGGESSSDGMTGILIVIILIIGAIVIVVIVTGQKKEKDSVRIIREHEWFRPSFRFRRFRL